MERIEEAVIEIPMGTKNKYEIDRKSNKIKLNRVQYSSMTYPAEYGFIENTLSNDNDPLDILVLTTEPTFPGCIVDARIVGYLKTIDNGFGDNKIISVNAVDPRFDEIKSINDIHEHTLLEIKNFFENYKKMQNIDVQVFDFYDKEEAYKVIDEAKNNYKENEQ